MAVTRKSNGEEKENVSPLLRKQHHHPVPTLTATLFPGYYCIHQNHDCTESEIKSKPNLDDVI